MRNQLTLCTSGSINGEDNNSNTPHRSRYFGKARRDKRIVGIYLKGSVQKQFFCHAQEVRAALERFRAAGILAYNMNWRNEIIT